MRPYPIARPQPSSRRRFRTAFGRAVKRARSLARRVATRVAAANRAQRARRRPRAWPTNPGGGGSAIEMWRADDDGVAAADSKLQLETLDELGHESVLRPSDLRVLVNRGAVTLSGTTGTYLAKVTAERVARRLRGVRLVRNDINVVPPSSQQRSDEELESAAARILEWNVLLAHAKLRVKAKAGWLHLEGELQRESEWRIAEESVQRLVGVKGVMNLITVKSPSNDVKLVKAS